LGFSHWHIAIELVLRFSLCLIVTRRRRFGLRCNLIAAIYNFEVGLSAYKFYFSTLISVLQEVLNFP
jgi:hypothetical protein